MLAAEDIQKMSVAERLEAIEMLWDSLAASEDKVPSPAWHGEIIAERLAAIDRREARFITLEEWERRLKRA